MFRLLKKFPGSGTNLVMMMEEEQVNSVGIEMS
jgi:hypothetical protein